MESLRGTIMRLTEMASFTKTGTLALSAGAGSSAAEEKAWKAGVEYGKKNKLKDVKSSEEMYQAAVQAGVSSSWFDVFKYGAHSAWRESGELKK